jgi:hypothetical protein
VVTVTTGFARAEAMQLSFGNDDTGSLCEFVHHMFPSTDIVRVVPTRKLRDPELTLDSHNPWRRFAGKSWKKGNSQRRM